MLLLCLPLAEVCLVAMAMLPGSLVKGQFTPDAYAFQLCSDLRWYKSMCVFTLDVVRLISVTALVIRSKHALLFLSDAGFKTLKFSTKQMAPYRRTDGEQPYRSGSASGVNRGLELPNNVHVIGSRSNQREPMQTPRRKAWVGTEPTPFLLCGDSAKHSTTAWPMILLHPY